MPLVWRYWFTEQGAALDSQLQGEDVSLADAPAELMGGQVIETEGKQVPILFAVSYDAGKIEDQNTYSLRVGIENGTGELLFINDSSVPVITQGNPTQDVEVIVVLGGG